MTGSELFDEYKKMDANERITFERLREKIWGKDNSEEFDRLDLIERRINVASALQSVYDEEGRPFFDVKWIIKNIFHFTDDEINISTGKN